VTVDTHDRSGKFISKTINPPEYKTRIYKNLDKDSHAEIQKIINKHVEKTSNLNHANETSVEKTEPNKNSTKGSPR
jgi:hypothetical protein